MPGLLIAIPEIRIDCTYSQLPKVRAALDTQEIQTVEYTIDMVPAQPDPMGLCRLTVTAHGDDCYLSPELLAHLASLED
jgi:hypothetical protein